MQTKNQFKKISLQGISLLLYLNALNLFAVFLALYLSSFFIFSTTDNIYENFRDLKLHGIIFSALLSIASGFIMNHFYDEEKDFVNKPIRSYLSSFISKQTYLILYLMMNILSIGIAFILSFRIGVFFIIYQFLLWLYSHKLSKIVVIKNFTRVFLVLFPFIALIFYFHKLNLKIILFASLLSLLLLIKDVLKDIRFHATDAIFNYSSIPNVFGIKIARYILLFLFIFSLFISFYLSNYKQIGDMIWYFRISNIIFVIGLILTILNKKIYFIILEWIFKIWIFLGILSIVLIDWKILAFNLI